MRTKPTSPGALPSMPGLENTLSSEDFDRMHEAAARLDEHRANGDIEAGTGPKSRGVGQGAAKLPIKVLASSRLQYDNHFDNPREMRNSRLQVVQDLRRPMVTEDYLPPA